MAREGGDSHEEGREACERGVPRADCPYPADSPERQGWIEGWDEAEEVKVVEGIDDEAGPDGGRAA
ncbi:ribosome modulation factor [Rubellimicrobium arenae]|uniref:ribosome modulation factor n=1 Tax=Rubellimicrobium arenae TaxID=2817372 RepID=UPI001B303D60|nr:Rmf/CrpP family protein [Rubellimicrobium arenae]